MIPTLHGQTTLFSNINTDIRIAKETGYQAIELHTDKLLRYLDAGYSAEDLRATLKTHGILPACIDILGGVERCTPTEHHRFVSGCGLFTSLKRRLWPIFPGYSNRLS